MSEKKNGKRYVSIVGSVVSGRSGNGWFGRYTGSDSVMAELGSSGDIEVYINSPGGSVFAGFEILNALNSAVGAGRNVTIYVSAMAASIASYITSGVKGAKIYMADNAKLMFHAPWTYTMGSKTQLQDTADLLGKMEDDIINAIVSRGAKADPEWFAAGRVKWFSAKEAIAAKLADEIANPPQELIAHVSKTDTAESSSRDDAWNKAKAKHDSDKLSERDLFAASSSFEGYIQALARERYGETCEVSVHADGTLRVAKEDGVAMLLKYTTDSLNIAAVEWDSAETLTEQESNMKTEAELKLEAEAKAKADSDAKAKQDAEDAEKAKVAADAKAKLEAEAKVKADADVKAKESILLAGMTEDMVAFAKQNYQPVRDEYIVAIKASKANEFADEELAKFDIATLAKMAKLSTKPSESDAVLQPDNSLIAPDLKAKGTGGSLPPPEM